MKAWAKYHKKRSWLEKKLNYILNWKKWEKEEEEANCHRVTFGDDECVDGSRPYQPIGRCHKEIEREEKNGEKKVGMFDEKKA